MSGAVIWFTGPSGAGKSTLAEAFGGSSAFGFSREHILENGRDIVEACKEEVSVLVAVITPFAQIRA